MTAHGTANGGKPMHKSPRCKSPGHTSPKNGASPGGEAQPHERDLDCAKGRADSAPRGGQAKPHRSHRNARKPQDRFAALDLGTNNCRLLIAAPKGGQFRVVDAFSRIVRLGEGLASTGALSDDAMERAVLALKICAEKVKKRDVTSARFIATQACRAASNGEAFLDRVKRETGLEFEIISTEEEARLAVMGCADLFDPDAQAGLVFDIGGGSTELSWVRPKDDGGRRRKRLDILAWTSLPVGVVSLSEEWGGQSISAPKYADIVGSVRDRLRAFGDPQGLRPIFEGGGAHLLGTSGTVTSIAGIHLGLERYRRDRVDGLWLTSGDARTVSQRLIDMDYEQRKAEPCVGAERADLVICGCAILEALLCEWPAERIRVADRGLREGILHGLAESARRKRKRRRRALRNSAKQNASARSN
ncbi:MAG: Ppx/GppA phosphatase family protein [Pseudomonadota bacterium]